MQMLDNAHLSVHSHTIPLTGFAAQACGLGDYSLAPTSWRALNILAGVYSLECTINHDALARAGEIQR